jgi:hypothetical protein
MVERTHFMFSLSEAGSYCVAQAGLELEILLPQPTKYWDYRCAPTHLAQPIFLPPSLPSLFFWQE